MKEFKLSIEKRKQKEIEMLIHEFNLTPWVIDMEDNLLYIITVEDIKSNSLLHELQIRGIGKVFGEVSITDVGLMLKGTQSETTLENSVNANLAELISEFEKSSLNRNYFILVIFSASLAALGLIANNAAIIIASMIVAPLLGPIALTSLGAVVPGRGFLQKGLLAEFIGISLTILVGIVAGLFGNLTNTFPELNSELLLRSELGILVVLSAIISGLAAGYMITNGLNVSIIGVAIAASLAPPATAVGLFLVKLETVHALQAFVVVIFNVLSINFACSLQFLLFRVSRKAGLSRRQSERVSKRNFINILIVGSLFLATATIAIIYAISLSRSEIAS